MFKTSVGGRDAARTMYRHALVRLMSPLLSVLDASPGWSAFSLALDAILMSWDPAPTLAQRFESTLAVLDAALPRRRKVGRTYQGFVKALTARSGAIFGVMIPHLRGLTEQAAGRCWRCGQFVPIGADGSRFDAPRTIGNEPLGFAGKDKCSPQMMTLLLVHLGAMLPWGWRIGGVRKSERALLREVLDQLPERTLLVADAGFTGFDLLCDLRRRGIHFLVRVGRGVRLLKDLGSYEREGKSTVYLWPDARRSCPPLVLRLIRVGSVYLITDVTDPRQLSKAFAAELYRRRWGLEVAFRSLKQTLQRRKVRSGTAVHARRELDWAMVGLWALALLGVRAIRRAGHEPRRLSIARSLSAVRAARAGIVSDRRLGQRMREAILDFYERKASKKAYRWPHKKRPSLPPGEPTVTAATATQVQHARSLPTKKHAA